jgi:ribonucleoside-triphosphate reductase
MAETKIPTEIYSRCVGYFRPTSQWNKGKQAEFNDRIPYKLEPEKNHDLDR